VLIRRAHRAERPYYQMTPNVQPSVAAICGVSGAGDQSDGSKAARRIQAAVTMASAPWSSGSDSA